MRFILSLAFTMLLSLFQLRAQSWIPAGPDDGNQPAYPAITATIVSDKAGGFFMAYTQNILTSSSNASTQASVRRWSNGSWQQVGTPGLSAAAVNYLQIAAAPGSIPYVVYKDYGNGGKATVKSFNGTSWQSTGGAVSPGGAAYTAIDIDAAGIPYVAYADSLASGRITVKKWTGALWQTVGSANFTPVSTFGIRLKLGNDGNPVVLAQYYAGSNSIAEVYRFSGTAWTSLGNATPAPANPNDADLALSATGDTAYVAFTDAGNGTKAAVRKYTGTGWANVGAPGISPSSAASVQLRIDSLNGPYLACLSNPAPGAFDPEYTMVRHFDGNAWVLAGADSFVLDRITQFPSFALDTAHIPHLLYFDVAYQGKALLRKLNGTSWDIQGTSKGFSDGPAYYVQTAVSPDGEKAYCITENFNPFGYAGLSAVFRYDNNTGWNVIGQSGISGWNGMPLAVAVHPDGQPWIVVNDSATHISTVWRYTGSSWVNTSIPEDTTGNAALAFDGAGTAYFAYLPWINGGLVVRKYTGTGWQTLNGSPIPSNGSVSYLRLKVNHAGVPHVLAGIHGSGGQYAYGVFKYDGTGWPSASGTINSGTGTASGSTPDFAFDASDTLYIAHVNTSSAGLKIAKFNSANYTFSDVAAVSPQRSAYPRIWFAPDGTLFLSYASYNTTYPSPQKLQVNVQRLAGNTWQAAGAPSFSKTLSMFPELIFLNNTMLTTFTDGAAYSYKYDCAQPATITQQPADSALCAGGDAGFTIAASGSTAYRWQVNSGQGWSDVPEGGSYSGVTSQALMIATVPASQNGYRFRCICTNACGGTMISNQATLLVDVPALPAPTLHITADHASACSGVPVTFTATSTNRGVLYTYEWRVNGTPVAGMTDSIFTTSALGEGDNAITCKLTRTSACGSGTAIANSNTVAVAIAPAAAPAIAITASPGTTISQGELVTFTATVTNGGSSPQYQWLRNNSAISGATAASYATSTLADGDMITARITRSDTCSDIHTAISQPLTIQVSTGIRDINKQYGFRLFPQPALNYVILSGGSNMPSGNYKLSLHSITGQLLLEDVLKVKGGSWTYRLDIPATLPAGLYRITLQGSGLVLGSMLSVAR